MDDAIGSYGGLSKKRDDSFAARMALTDIADEGGGSMKYGSGVGWTFICQTCRQGQASAEQKRRLADMNTMGHMGVEITAVIE